MAEAEVVNVASGASWDITVDDATGSFAPVAVEGDANDWIAIRAVDAHPEPAESITDAKQLPPNAAPPEIREWLIDFAVDEGGAVHLTGGTDAVIDEETPIVLSIVNPANGFSTSLEVSADRSFDVVVLADAGDVLTLTAVDGHPDQGTSEPLYLTVPLLFVEAAFEAGEISVDETAGVLSFDVVLTADRPDDVTVRYRTVPGSATPGTDYEEASGLLVFTPGQTRRTVEVQVLDDQRPEGNETFRLELFDEIGLVLGEPSAVEVTIVNDDFEIDTVTFSVGVGTGNLLTTPIGIDIADGTATFTRPLPAAVDRGDMVDVDDLGAVYLGTCSSDTVCQVHNGRGYDAGGVIGGTASTISRAFPSLADAIIEASDSAHLDTLDLVSVDASLQFLCYGGSADTNPVAIDGWITSPETAYSDRSPDC